MWLRRFEESWYFREMLYRLTIFWGLGAGFCFAVTAAVVLPKTVDKYVAFGFGESWILDCNQDVPGEGLLLEGDGAVSGGWWFGGCEY